MRMWILFLVLIAAIVPISFAATGGGGTNPIPPPPNFYIQTNVTTVCRGEVNLIPITLAVSGSGGMENTQIGLVGGKGLYTLGNSTISLPVVNQTSPQTGDLPIFVSSNASFVQAELSINYYYYTIYTDSETRNVSLWITTCPLPLSVNVNPKILVAGSIQNITFNITNTGVTPLNSISLKTTFPSQYAAVLDNQPIDVGSVPGMSKKTISASVYVYKNASQLLPALVNITFFNGVLFEESLNTLDLLTAGTINLTTSSLTVSPSAPAPGSIFSISFVLTNTGTDSASALAATALAVKGFTTFGSSSVFVGDVGADSQTPITLTFVASNSIRSGNYTIPIRINYLNSFRDNISMTMNVSVGIVGGSSFTSSNSVIRSGTSVSVYRTGGSIMLVVVIGLVVVVIVESVLIFKTRRRRHPK